MGVIGIELGNFKVIEVKEVSQETDKKTVEDKIYKLASKEKEIVITIKDSRKVPLNLVHGQELSLDMVDHQTKLVD